MCFFVFQNQIAVKISGLNHSISQFSIIFKNSIEEIRSNKIKISATEEVVIYCFNYSTARTHRDIELTVSRKLYLKLCSVTSIKVTKI